MNTPKEKAPTVETLVVHAESKDPKALRKAMIDATHNHIEVLKTLKEFAETIAAKKIPTLTKDVHQAFVDLEPALTAMNPQLAIVKNVLVPAIATAVNTVVPTVTPKKTSWLNAKINGAVSSVLNFLPNAITRPVLSVVASAESLPPFLKNIIFPFGLGTYGIDIAKRNLSVMEIRDAIKNAPGFIFNGTIEDTEWEELKTDPKKSAGELTRTFVESVQAVRTDATEIVEVTLSALLHPEETLSRFRSQKTEDLKQKIASNPLWNIAEGADIVVTFDEKRSIERPLNGPVQLHIRTTDVDDEGNPATNPAKALLTSKQSLSNVQTVILDPANEDTTLEWRKNGTKIVRLPEDSNVDLAAVINEIMHQSRPTNFGKIVIAQKDQLGQNSIQLTFDADGAGTLYVRENMKLLEALTPEAMSTLTSVDNKLWTFDPTTRKFTSKTDTMSVPT